MSRYPIGPRTAEDIQRELRRAVAAMMLHPRHSRTYRQLKLRRDALALEFGLTHGQAVFQLGAL